MILEVTLRIDVGENFLSDNPTQAELDWLYMDLMNEGNLCLESQQEPIGFIIGVGDIKLTLGSTGPDIPKTSYFNV